MNIFLNSGEMVQIQEEYQFRELLREHLGDDAEKFLDTIISDYQYGEDVYKSEMEVAQDGCHNLEQAMLHVEQQLIDLLGYLLTAKRIDRTKLYDTINDISKLADVNKIDY